MIPDDLRHLTPAERAARARCRVEVRIPLSLDQCVTVTATSPLDDDGWEQFMEALEFMKPGLCMPTVSSSPASEPTPPPPASAPPQPAVPPPASDAQR
jgi:hypothetical protein